MSLPVVTIEQGQLRGTIKVDIEGQNYFSFLGIPYAKPPIGNLRFKAPVPPDNWTGTFDATKEGNASYSRNPFSKMVGGSEDCLNLNVFTKKLPDGNKSQLVPVMFWIFGGAFIQGSSSTAIFGPDFLITQNLVIVSINFRLGMLGFLNCEDPSLGVSGNAGIKDAVLALRWVQKNISKFGGDPDNVTIFGESTGGLTTHLLMLSSITKGLFHKVIAQSACALNSWHGSQLGCKHIAEAIGRTDLDEKSLLQYLTNLSVEEIFDVQDKFQDEILPGAVKPFGSVTENEAQEFTLLSEKPIDIILSGNYNKVPLMVGYTTAEAMAFRTAKKLLNRSTDLELLVPHMLGYKFKSKERRTILNKMLNFYFDKEELKRIVENFDLLTTDAAFIYGIQAAAKNHAITSNSPVYLYRMSVESSLNCYKEFMSLQEYPGVCHCDDLGYLFKNLLTPEIVPGSLEEISMQRFVKLWANFARYGNPTPEKDRLFGNVIWKPVDSTALNFLDIGKELTTGVNPEAERMKFWNDIYENSPGGNKILLSRVKPIKTSTVVTMLKSKF